MVYKFTSLFITTFFQCFNIVTLDYKALILIAIRKEQMTHTPEIILGGRGYGVEFCIFCTAIRVWLYKNTNNCRRLASSWDITFRDKSFPCSEAYRTSLNHFGKMPWLLSWVYYIGDWYWKISFKAKFEFGVLLFPLADNVTCHILTAKLTSNDNHFILCFSCMYIIKYLTNIKHFFRIDI
jgi:hypothetical protein